MGFGYLGNKEILRGYLGENLIYGIAPPYVFQAETQEVIDRAILEGFTIPDQPWLKAYDKLIKAWILEDTFWSTRDSIQLQRLGNSTYKDFSRIDIKNPTGTLATDHGGGTYTIDGIKGNGVDAYRNPNFNPAMATNMTIDSIGITHILMGNYAVSKNQLMGAQKPSPTIRLGLFPNYDDNKVLAYSNDLEQNLIYLDNGIPRVLTFGRNSNVKYLINNGAKTTLITAALTPFIDILYYINACNDKGSAKFFCDGTCGFSAFGSDVSLSQHEFIKTTLNTFFTNIGIATI